MQASNVTAAAPRSVAGVDVVSTGDQGKKAAFATPAATFGTLVKAAAANDKAAFADGLTDGFRRMLGEDLEPFMLQFQGMPYADPDGFDVVRYAAPAVGPQLEPAQPIATPKEGDKVLCESIPHEKTIEFYAFQVGGRDTPEFKELLEELRAPETFIYQNGGWRLHQE